MTQLFEFQYFLRTFLLTVLFVSLYTLSKKHSEKLPQLLQGYLPLGFLLMVFANVAGFIGDLLRIVNDISHNLFGVTDFYSSILYILPSNLSTIFYTLGSAFVFIGILLFLTDPLGKGLTKKVSIFNLILLNILTFGFYNVYWIITTFRTVGGEEGERLGKLYGNWLIILWVLLFSSYGIYMGYGNDTLLAFKLIITYITSMAFGITMLVACYHLKKFIVIYDSRYRQTDFSDLGIFFFTILALQYGINEKVSMKIKEI